MKAARLHEPGGAVRIEEAEVPRPGPGEALVKMEACGLCHSDLFIQSLPALKKTPLTLGHEGIGVVESLGEGATGVRVGERVGITYLWGSCGRCEYCRAGRRRLCPEQINTGYDVDGAFAEYAVARVDALARIPAELDAVEAAPLCCAGWTAYRAVEEAALEPGQWLAVYGVGGLGRMALQFAALNGLHTAAIDVAEEKLAVAAELGAELTIDASKERPSRALRKIGGAHAAISFVASAGVVREAIGGLRRGGTLVLVGLAAETFEAPLVELVVKGVRLQGSFLGSDEDLARVFELAREGKIRTGCEPCRLEDLPEKMERMREGKLAGRVAVVF